MKNKEDIKFKIDQLRKDKIVYATESIATSVAMILVLFTFGTFSFFSPVVVFGFTFIISIGFWLFTVIGNIKRLSEIKKLEKLLK